MRLDLSRALFALAATALVVLVALPVGWLATAASASLEGRRVRWISSS